MIFFFFFLSEDLSIRRILSVKKYGGTGLISEKSGALYVELNERAEAAASSYSAASDFLQHVYSELVTKIRPKCLVHEIFYTYFLTISIMVTEQLY